MFFDNITTSIIISYTTSIISIMILLTTLLLLFNAIKNKKSKKLIFLELIIIIVSLFGSTLMLPWAFQTHAMELDEQYQRDKFYNIALKTAIYPQVKAEIYAQMATDYLYNKDSKKALSLFENAKNFSSHFENIYMLGLLYNLYEKYDKAAEIYKQVGDSKSLIMTYILKKDYNKALFTANFSAFKQKKEYFPYAYSANIYINMPNKTKEAEKCYLKAIELCPQKTKEIKALYSDKNYVTKIFNEYRKLYGIK